MATFHNGSLRDEEVEDDLLAILLGGQRPAAITPAEASRPEGSADRGRSRSRDQAGRLREPPPAANASGTGVWQASGTEEEEWLHLPLNVIESNPDDEEAFDKMQQRVPVLLQSWLRNRPPTNVKLSSSHVQSSSPAGPELQQQPPEYALRSLATLTVYSIMAQ